MEIPPRAFGFPRSRETFQSRTGPAFDYLAAIETAASVPFSYLFNADRFNRLLTYKARNANQPGVDQILNKTVSSVWMNPSTSRGDRTIQKVVEMEMLKQLMGLAINKNSYPDVSAKAYASIFKIKDYANARTARRTNEDGFYYQYVVSQIERFLDQPNEFGIPDPIKAPDGSPIGTCNHY